MRFKPDVPDLETQYAHVLALIELKRVELFARMRDSDCFLQTIDRRNKELSSLHREAEGIRKAIAKATKNG